MIYAINFADSAYEFTRKENTRTAYKIGKVDKVIEYTPKDIDELFKTKCSHIFSYNRGFGLWIWKPYLILKTLLEIDIDDYLIYTDSGSYFINDVSHLLNVMRRDCQDVMCFELPLLSRQYTKKETFIGMGYEKFDDNQILAGYIILKKSDYTISFIREWLDNMMKEELLSFKKFNLSIEEFPDFIAHREDQSIFSILCRKHNIIPYRDPSQFGVRPWLYATNKNISIIKKYCNSNYPTIIISNRNIHPVKYRIREFVINLLYLFNIRTKDKFLKMHNISASNYLEL